MKFKINGNEWEIVELSGPEMAVQIEQGLVLHGQSCYDTNKIQLNKDVPEMIKSLKHELTHVWMYEYGHNQNNKEFDKEDVCEIVASINDFINEIVEEYKKEKENE